MALMGLQLALPPGSAGVDTSRIGMDVALADNTRVSLVCGARQAGGLAVHLSRQVLPRSQHCCTVPTRSVGTHDGSGRART